METCLCPRANHNGSHPGRPCVGSLAGGLSTRHALPPDNVTWLAARMQRSRHVETPGLGGERQGSTHRRVLRHLAHLQQDTVSTPPASGDPAPACATNAGAKALSRKSASAPRLLDAMANEEKAKKIANEVQKPRLRRCRTPDQQTQRKKLQAAALRNSTPTPPEGRHAVVAGARLTRATQALKARSSSNGKCLQASCRAPKNAEAWRDKDGSSCAKARNHRASL